MFELIVFKPLDIEHVIFRKKNFHIKAFLNYGNRKFITRHSTEVLPK